MLCSRTCPHKLRHTVDVHPESTPLQTVWVKHMQDVHMHSPSTGSICLESGNGVCPLTVTHYSSVCVWRMEAIRKPLVWSRAACAQASSLVTPSHKTQLKMKPSASQTKASVKGSCSIHYLRTQCTQIRLHFTKICFCNSVNKIVGGTLT